jgi:hypothetical protein
MLVDIKIDFFNSCDYVAGRDYAYVEYAHDRTTGAVINRTVRVFVGIAYEWNTDFAAEETAARAYYSAHSIADFKAMEPSDNRW